MSGLLGTVEPPVYWVLSGRRESIGLNRSPPDARRSSIVYSSSIPPLVSPFFFFLVTGILLSCCPFYVATALYASGALSLASSFPFFSPVGLPNHHPSALFSFVSLVGPPNYHLIALFLFVSSPLSPFRAVQRSPRADPCDVHSHAPFPLPADADWSKVSRSLLCVRNIRPFATFPLCMQLIEERGRG